MRMSASLPQPDAIEKQKCRGPENGMSERTFHFHRGGQAAQLFTARDFAGAQHLVACVCQSDSIIEPHWEK
jgi:hypothetical protein